MKKVVFLLMISFGLNSCKQTDQGHPQTVLDSYLLTSNQKALFNYFAPNNNIQFFDSVNQTTIQIKEISETDYDSCDFHSQGDVGEEIKTNYNVLTSINEISGLGCSLIALPNNACLISLSFWIDTNKFYLSSNFAFNPYDSNKLDTTYTPPGGFGVDYANYPYKFLDSVTFSSHTFYNVYYLKTNNIVNPIAFVNNCYYSLSEGIIGFQMQSDSTFWIRGN